MKQAGLFDLDDRRKRLSDIGDQLGAYSGVIDFEMFRAELEAAVNQGRAVEWKEIPS